MRRWEEFLDDAGRLLDHVASAEPTLPTFLLGHSMGGLIALDVALRRPERLRGLVLSGTALRPVEVGSRPLLLAARLLSNVWPSFSVDVPLGSISRDPAVLAATRADPLNHRRGSARWATESLAAIRRLEREASALHVPVLLIHGEDDTVIDPEGSRWLAGTVGSEDRTLHLVPGARHEPHNDLGRESSVRVLVDWVLARL